MYTKYYCIQCYTTVSKLVQHEGKVLTEMLTSGGFDALVDLSSEVKVTDCQKCWHFNSFPFQIDVNFLTVTFATAVHS